MKMVKEFEAAIEFLQQFENKRQSGNMKHLNATSDVADGIALNPGKLPEKSDPSQASYIEKFLGPKHSQRSLSTKSTLDALSGIGFNG